MTKLSIGLIFLALLLAGCTEDRGTIERKILDHDPSFQKSIDHRDSIQKELDSQKVSYIQKKKDIRSEIQNLKEEIETLKEDEAGLKTEYIDTLGEIKQRIYPKKRSLKQDLTDMHRRLKRKKTEIHDIDKDINEINALVKKKERLSLTREEIEVWNKRFSSLVERKALVEKEVDEIRRDIEITELKIKILVVE